MNTKLEDVASAVQVVTPEFLQDVGATNTASVLIYTTSTEAGGISGNFSSAELSNQTIRDERVRRSPQANTRVRGLDRADLTRNFFLSDIPIDSYNVDQITVNRGPNAALFGLGSPGGIVDSTLIKPQMTERFGELGLLVDNYGTIRATLDFNQPLVEDRLAIRVAGLRERKGFEQKPAFDDNDRVYIVVEAKPFSRTRIKANYEKGDGVSNRPYGSPPRDRLTGWFANGRPGINPVTEEWTVNGQPVTDQAQSDAFGRLNRGFQQGGDGVPVVIFDDPDSPNMGNYTYGTMQAGLATAAAGRDLSPQFSDDTRARVLRIWGGTRGLISRDPTYHAGGRPDIPLSHAPYYQELSLTDRSIFDYRKDILSGPNKREWRDFWAKEISIEQTTPNNRFGAEVSYNQQSLTDTLYVTESAGTNNTLTVDINTHLLDGSVNPNFGRPVVHGQGFVESRIIDRQAFRITGFGDLDFAEDFGKVSDGMLKFLGRHRLTVLYQDSEMDRTSPNRQSENVGPGWKFHAAVEGFLDTLPGDDRITGPQRGSTYRALGPSLADVESPVGLNLRGVRAWQVPQSTDNALAWNPLKGQMEQASVVWNSYINNPLAVWTWGNPRTLEEIESKVGILQSHFLHDKVVATISYRSDSVRQFSGLAGTNPATGLTIPGPVKLGQALIDETEDQSSWGVVVHSFDFINKRLPVGTRFSIHYNDATNFSAGTAGKDILNRPLPFQSGVTEEYGFSITTLNERFFVRVNWYETGQVFARSGSLQTPGIWQIFGQIMENNSPQELDEAGFSLDMLPSGLLESVQFRPVDPNVPNDQTSWESLNPSAINIQVTSDTVSKGAEIEIAFNPTPNWRIHLNASKTDATLTNVMPVFIKVWEELERDIFTDPEIGGKLFIRPVRYFSDGSLNEESLLINSRLLGSFQAGIRTRQAVEGGAPQELRKYRVNLITNYAFDGSYGPDWLSGFGIGAGIRWQGENYIGTELMELDGKILPDNSKKIKGPDELLADAWLTYSTTIFQDRYQLDLEFRVRNLNSGEGLIPVRANPDGELALFRIEPSRTFEFSARLSF